MGQTNGPSHIEGLRRCTRDHLDSFVHTISREIAVNYGLHLRGSWSREEFHALRSSSSITSYSDIDLVSDRSLPDTQTRDVFNLIDNAAAQCQLCYSRVSIRRKREMRDMWEVVRHQSSRADAANDQVNFLVFWMLVGAADATLVAHRCDYDRRLAEYLLNKWLLLIWRDIAILENRPAATYSDAVALASEYMPPQVALASYYKKLGLGGAISWREVQREHRRSLIAALSPRLTDPARRRLVRRMLSLRWLTASSRTTLTEDLLQMARLFEGDMRGRRAALGRLAIKVQE